MTTLTVQFPGYSHEAAIEVLRDAIGEFIGIRQFPEHYVEQHYRSRDQSFKDRKVAEVIGRLLVARSAEILDQEAG